MLPLGTVESPELVMGRGGRVGLDTRLISEIISDVLLAYNYEVKSIKLTGLMPELETIPKITNHPIEEYYNSRIVACNKLREISGRNDILALLAMIRIRELRAAGPEKDPDAPLKRVAFIIDQIKRPEETELLRQVYRDFFIQVSCHAPRDVRERRLAVKISNSHPENPREENWRSTAAQLIGRDDAEEDQLTGQRVREVLPLADVVINASQEETARQELNRFFEIFFGCPTRSPTLEEYGLATAFSASLRSIDMSRQVGAAILSIAGDVLALGCNEVPKAGGGTYWEGDADDARDAALGEDLNTRRKRLMVTDIVYRLAKNKLAPERFADCSIEQLESELIDDESAPLKDCLILDSLEFGRQLHAEMCAVASAAKIGISLHEHALYCTTFPCHNCAKHIVGVGIRSVIYLQPYPKSHVSELYPDSIEIDSPFTTEGKIAFKQFVGLTPARYYLFEKSRLKDDKGIIKKWNKRVVSPASRQVIPFQSDLEKFTLSTFEPALVKIRPPAQEKNDQNHRSS